MDTHDLGEIVSLAKKLDDLHFALYATEETAAAIARLGIDVVTVDGIRESDHAFALLESGCIDYIVFDTGALSDATMDDYIAHAPPRAAARHPVLHLARPTAWCSARTPPSWIWETLGPQFEHAKYFPDRINTEFVRIVNENTLRMRVYERGNGETVACGTGACAAVIAATENGFVERARTSPSSSSAATWWSTTPTMRSSSPAMRCWSTRVVEY